MHIRCIGQFTGQASHAHSKPPVRQLDDGGVIKRPHIKISEILRFKPTIGICFKDQVVVRTGETVNGRHALPTGYTCDSNAPTWYRMTGAAPEGKWTPATSKRIGRSLRRYRRAN